MGGWLVAPTNPTRPILRQTSGKYYLEAIAGAGMQLALTTAQDNVFIGNGAADVAKTGSDMVVIGKDALGANTDPIRVTAIGLGALGRATTDCEDTIAIGRRSLYGASFTGKYNLAIGQAAGEAINDASQRMTIVGPFAMQGATGNASGVTAIGAQAGFQNNDDYATVIGYQVGSGHTNMNASVVVCSTVTAHCPTIADSFSAFPLLSVL